MTAFDNIELFFRTLQEEKIEYIVLRNHAVIPAGITVDNDMDVLVRKKDKEKLRKTMRVLHFSHAIDSKYENSYFYGTLPHEHFFDYKKNIHIDVVFQLAYRSPNRGEWIPAHKEIQQSMWDNRINDNSFVGLWKPSPLDELLHIIAHCIFDKKKVATTYEKRIYDLFAQVDHTTLRQLLPHLFFNFSDDLIMYIQKKQLTGIFHNYISFRKY